jgi:release factor glutamine methyltransferase
MKKLLKKITHPFYKKYHFWYHKRPRKYVYKNVFTMVQPTVFSPKNTISTKIFLDYISTLDFQNKTVLELGCGSGIVSIFSASKGAKVTASDIHKITLNSLEKVSKKQGFNIDCVYSNLFENIKMPNRVESRFDYIFINPPYYPKKPKNIEEQAWFCGENFEYFKNLFNQLPRHINKNQVFMILSEDCDLKTIKNIAYQNKLNFTQIYQKQTILEKNYIYKMDLF